MYRITDDNGSIIRESDNACIPEDYENLDYAEFINWVSEGNTPLPYEPPPVDLKAAARAELAATDSEIARVSEDLIQTLISKGVIAESDIPAPAHDKMARRAELRSRLAQ